MADGRLMAGGAIVCLLTVASVVRSGDLLEPADLVLTGGKLVTVDVQRPLAEALAVRGDQIVAVGSAAEIARCVGPDTRVIELDGKLVLPGFIEGHAHFLGLGQSKMMLDLTAAETWEELVQQVATAAANTPEGDWIVGRGWHQSKWVRVPRLSVEGTPTHEQMSSVTPHHPVLLTHASGHMCIVNARALQLAEVDRDTVSPPGGEILRHPDGQPTGVLRENAMELVARAEQRSRQGRSPQQLRTDLLTAIGLASDECLRHGITSFHDAGSPLSLVDTYRQLADDGKLRVRLWVMVNDDNDVLARWMSRYRVVGAGDNFLTVRAVKRLMDGALGSHGAWLLEPYDDLPSSRGLNTLPIEELRRAAELAIEHDYQLCVHAIGDRANREVLDVYESVWAEHPKRGQARWRIEHAQHLHPDDVPRFAQLGVIAAMQAIHATSDGPFVMTRLGQRRSREGAYAWRSLLDSGAVIANGTDAPVEPVDPLAGFRASVTRELASGVSFFPEQCMTREQALRSYTLDAAYAAFEEELKGSLTPGKLADIVVLSHDIMTVPASQIREARVLLTIVGGRVMYAAEEAR